MGDSDSCRGLLLGKGGRVSTVRGDLQSWECVGIFQTCALGSFFLSIFSYNYYTMYDVHVYTIEKLNI